MATKPQSTTACSAEEIGQYLEELFKRDRFRKSPSLHHLLEYVVRKTVDGRVEEIKESIIAIDVFGRSHDFDGRLDNIVRVQAHRLRKTPEAYYAAEGADDRLTITIPKGSYVPSIERRDEKPVFETIVQREAEPERDHAETRPPVASQRPFPRLALVSVFLAGALIASLVTWKLMSLRIASVRAGAVVNDGRRPPLSALWAAFLQPGVACVVSFTNPVFLGTQAGPNRAYANQIRIHYYHAPAPGKPVIVMVHGVTDNGLCWTTLTQELQKDYDIYMLDARGHGLSDPFRDADTGDTLIEDVVGFVQAMKLDKPVLMGHSMGAATVMRVGAQYPDLACAVIMLDPGLGRRGPGGRGTPGTGAPGRGAPGLPAGRGAPSASPDALVMFGAPEALVEQNNRSFDELVGRCRRQDSKWDPVDCQYWALSKKQYHGAYSTAQWQAMSGTMAAGDSLSKITVPALILKADASAEVRKSNEEAASVMKKGKLVHIDGAGHNLHHDQRKRTVDELTAFLKTL